MASVVGIPNRSWVPVGVGSGGGRKEADVVGVKIIETDEQGRKLQIYHVEVGELMHACESNVQSLKSKFSPERTQEIVTRCKQRVGLAEQVEYEKVYVDIWSTESKVARLMNHADIEQEGIKVWTPKRLFQEVLRAIAGWIPTHKSKSKEATLLECWWMLKLLECLREWELLNIEIAD